MTAPVAGRPAREVGLRAVAVRRDHLDGLQRGDQVGVADGDVARADLVLETEQLVLARAPEVGVHDDDLLAGERQRHGEVGDRDALALALQAAGDEQRLGVAVDVHEGEVGAQQAERLGDGVGGVLEGHQVG